MRHMQRRPATEPRNRIQKHQYMEENNKFLLNIPAKETLELPFANHFASASHASMPPLTLLIHTRNIRYPTTQPHQNLKQEINNAQWKFKLTILHANYPTLLHNQALLLLLSRRNPHLLKRFRSRPKDIPLARSPRRSSPLRRKTGLLLRSLWGSLRRAKGTSLRDGTGPRVGTHGRGISVAQV
jgi:hypothetical protein